MKVAYITSISKQSGTATHAQTVMKELATRDEIDLWAVNTRQTHWPETFVHEGDDYPWVFPDKLDETLLDLDPDVVLVHVFNTELFTMLENLSEELEAAWVYRHGTNMVEQWFSRAMSRPLALSALKSAVWDLGWFDALVCPTQTAADRMDLYYGDAVPARYVIPNALDLKTITPSTYYDSDTLKIVMATRMAPINYYPLPILAVRRLVEDVDVSFRIFGGGNEALRSSVDRLVGDAETFEVMGHVDHEVVLSNLEEADIAVVPTFSQNAVPYSALEGLAAGCLTIASDCAATREEPSLVLCSHEDPTTWYRALTDAATDVEDAKDFVREGLQSVRSYRVERIVDEGYLPMFEELT